MRNRGATKSVIGLAVLLAGAALPAAGGSAPSRPTSFQIHNGVIVFTRDDAEHKTSNLYAISPKGGVPWLLVGGNDVDFPVSWSPDGSRFVFQRDTGPIDNLGPEKVVVANADGSNVREIADGYDPVWSPAGGDIAYEKYVGPTTRIFVIHPDGSGKRALTPPRLDANIPTWSPSGRQLAFDGSATSGESFVYLVDESGRDLHKLTPVLLYQPSPLAWSPHGKLLVFTTSKPFVRYTKLFLANTKGGKTRTLVARPSESLGGIGSISWSRDGRTIAFDANGHAGGVYLVRASGFGLKRVGRGRLLDAFGPRWSPDGRELLFTALNHGNYGFEIVNSRGRLVRWIDPSTTYRDSDPAWQPVP